MKESIKPLISFRNDIQGLRGLAILFVLIFHFFPSIFPKGYLGVDIFFIISGYLVTSIYLAKKNYPFVDFIKKRIIRLIPSILGTIILCILLSFFIFLPSDLSHFWNSVISSVFLVPNFYFLINGGYFGGINELKPLLHFWSLGIEIQFYIVYPLILVFIKNQFKKNFLILIFIIFFISFVLNFFFINHDKINFFMLPTRMWQFCLGSAIFFLPKNNFNKKYNNFFNILFTILVIFIVFLDFNLTSLLLKFIISIYISLILFFGANTSGHNFFLDNPFLNFLGKISYSLYLIHWPILVFFKYYLIREISNQESFLLMLFVVLCSFFFWKYVENLFHKKLKSQIVFRTIIISLIGIFFLFFISYSNNFFPQRINNEANLISKSINTNYKCNKIDFYLLNKLKSCHLKFNKSSLKDDIILIGNSHAQMYGYTFEKILEKKNYNGLIVAINGCLPTITYNISKSCIDKAKINLNKIIKDKSTKQIIIGLDWDHEWLIGESNKKIKNEKNIILSSAVYELIQIFEKNNIETFLIGPISTPNFEFPSIVSRSLFFYNQRQFPNYYETLKEFEIRFKETFNFFESKKFKKIIKPHLIQCKNRNCIFSVNGNSLFSDSTHLSKFGSSYIEKAFFDFF